MKKIFLSLVVLSLFAACAQRQRAEVSLLPVPREHKIDPRGEFHLTPDALIVARDSSLREVAAYAAELIGVSSALPLTLSADETGALSFELGLENPDPEAYELTVSSAGVRVVSATRRGAVMAVATLNQLIGADRADGVWLPYMQIKDAPRFAHRGIMLDVSRHFQDIQAVKHVIDLIARYKFNKFHWHLTDDQGWRVEIKRYPLLTEKGAWRKWNWQDKQCMAYERELDNPDFIIPEKYMKIDGVDTLYGGHYTQHEIRDVVAYAALRGIDVIPEVDMPGHLMAAITGYPQLSCKGTAAWGASFSDPLCVGSDEALQITKDIYTEIAALFPYEYMHLGADEVEWTEWKKCPKCQKRIRDEKLGGVDELQAWFVRGMEQHFTSLGKKLIGWDEIVHGGFSPTATIMWWRNWSPESLRKAVEAGNRVIIVPSSTLYFDAWEDGSTLRRVFEYEPLPSDFTPEQAQCVVGVQGNLWCETIPSLRRIEHQYFPRMLALSEVAWSGAARGSWDEFAQRAVRQIDWLDSYGMNYRVPNLTGFERVNAFTETALVWVECPFPSITVRYTTDGKFPSAASPILREPLLIDKTTNFIFRGFRPDGTSGEMYKAEYRKEDFSKALDITPEKHGMRVARYDYRGKVCAEIDQAPLVEGYVMDSLNLTDQIKGWFSIVGEGFFEVNSDSIYTFALNSNDGSMLYVDGELLIDNDTPHGDREIRAQKALAKGWHSIRVEFFDMNNGGCLQLKIDGRTMTGFRHK